MTKDNDETTEKPAASPLEGAAPASAQAAEAPPGDAQAARPRKIVRRSASTREHPAFTPTTDEAAAAGSAPADPSGPEGASAPTGAKPVEARPRATYDARAPRPPRPTFDARAPRPRAAPPSAGASGDAAPYQGPRRSGEGRPARPGGGDYRPPAARPMGARPLPGGPRAPLPGREEGRGERRGPGPEPSSREAPAPRPSRPETAAAGRPAAPPKGTGADRAQRSAPAVKAQGPAPFRSAAAPVRSPARPAPLPLSVPLPRASGGDRNKQPALTAKEVLSARAKAASASKGKAPAARSEAEASARPAQTFEPEIQNASEDTAREALQKAGDAAPQLIEAWLGASNAPAIIAVAEADEAPAAARKAARRALNVLRARGVPIPERSHVVRIDDRAEVSLEATLIPPDSNGTIAVSITSRDASGRYHIAEVIIREPFGVVQAASGWLSGSQLKEGRNRALEGLGVAPVPVPVEWARHRIAAARQQNADSRQIVPLGLERCRELIEPAPESAPAHPLAQLEGEVTAERVALAVQVSGTLHMEPEFRSWLPDRMPLDELLQRVGERLGPDGVKNADRVNQAIFEEIEAATDRFFSPEVRALLEARLRDCAISVRARKGDARALDVLAVGRAVREAGLITAPPREIPFLVGFFQKALGVLAQQGGGQLRVPVSAEALAEPAMENAPDKPAEEEPPPVEP